MIYFEFVDQFIVKIWQLCWICLFPIFVELEYLYFNLFIVFICVNLFRMFVLLFHLYFVFGYQYFIHNVFMVSHYKYQHHFQFTLNFTQFMIFICVKTHFSMLHIVAVTRWALTCPPFRCLFELFILKQTINWLDMLTNNELYSVICLLFPFQSVIPKLVYLG